MKRVTIFAASLLVCLVVSRSSAEVYMGIGPLSTLRNVKKIFPRATYKLENPARAKKEDVMYSLTGPGISGQIIIMFKDKRPHSEMLIEKAKDNVFKDFFKRQAEISDEEALYVMNVRWIPDTPFPLERLIKKYGNPDRSDFRPEDYQPYKYWERGVQAFLSEDGKNVVMIEYSFTEKEYMEFFKRKVEEELKRKEVR